MLRHGPAVLGDISQWQHTPGCIKALTRSLDLIKAEGELIDIDTETAARLINGASSHMALWIANAEDPENVSKKAVAGFRTMLDGFRRR